MIRRVLFIGLGATAIGFLAFGHSFSSYVRTAKGWVSDSVKSAVPVNFEIDRARNMVKDIMLEIRKNMQIIAKEEVEVERLDQEIGRLEKKQDKDKTELMSLKTEAASGKSNFKFAGRTYTIDQVKCDLANRFERYKTSDATLASLHEIQSARQKGLSAAREKLEGMLAQKRQLEVEVENLQARVKMVEVAQTANSCSFDDSQLGHVKELINDLQTRINVDEKMLHVEGTLQTEIPLDQPAVDSILDQMTEYFAPAKSTVVQVAEVKSER